LARDFANARPGLAIGGGSAGAQTNGTDALTAILALNTLVGNVGRAGGVLPNPPSVIEGFPTPTGPNRLADWQSLADRMRNGQTQALLVWGANPVHDLPSSLRVKEALAAVPYIVSFSSFMDETTMYADLILPSSLPLEDWGDDVPDPGPGYPVYSVQQPVVRPLYDTRGVTDVLLAAAQELGGPVAEGLPWNNMRELIRENAKTVQAQGRGSVQDADFERFWNKLLQQGGWWDTTQTGGSPGSASVQGLSSSSQPAQFDGDSSYPYYLAVFPHHTLGTGEGAHIPWMQSTPDPITSVAWQTWVEMNPGDAHAKGIAEGDIVAIVSKDGGRIEVPVYIHPAASPNVLSVPLGQGHTAYTRYATRDGGVRGANPLDLLAPLTDQATGALAYGATRVRLEKTGRHISIPKFEGNVVAIQLPGAPVVEITRGES
jgi:anaerobic selenocysteine-containing dehydrogenase